MIKNSVMIFTIAAFLMCLPALVYGETINLDYSFGGAGVRSFTLNASVAFCMNSWCTNSVIINGIDKTNVYSTFFECGTYVIEYSSSFSYGHIEFRAIGIPCFVGGGGEDPTPEPTLEPTPEPTPEPDPTLEPEPDPTLEPEPDPTLEPEPTSESTLAPTQEPGNGPVSEYGQLRVSGSHIVSASNNLVQLKGFSSHGLQWFPYATGANGTLEHLVESFNIQVLRAAMYAYEWDLGRSQWAGYLGVHPNLYNDQVRPLIQDAIDNGIYIIVDWHIHWNPSDPNNMHWTPDPHTNEAKAFFSMVAQEFGSYENVIYEVINEPGHGISWSQVKTHAYEVISAIRQYDPDNIILVPSPIWGQDPVTPSNDPLLDAVDADNDGNTSEKAPNVAYTIHFYAMSHNFRDSADQAMSNGIALFATEWGVSDYSGDGYIDISEGGPAAQWINWMEANSISWTAWSFCNKGESSAILQPYSYDNIENEARWPVNEIMNGYYMQSGPWGNTVIKDAGIWLRDKINNLVIPPTVEPIPDPTPESTVSPGGSVLEVELENLLSQSLFSPLAVTNDSAASGGQAIQWPDNGNLFLTGPSDTTDGQVLISFTLSQTANVEFIIRAKFDNPTNDSFYYKMDSGSWSEQNYVTTSGYWILTPTTFNGLGPGSHTLRILRREDGALLDKVSLRASDGIIAAVTYNPPPGTPVFLQAEYCNNNSGVAVYLPFIGSCDNGDWISFNNVNLGSGYSTIRVRVATGLSNNSVEVRAGSIYGTLLGTINIYNTGGYNLDNFNEQTCSLSGARGVNTIYFVFKGSVGVGNFDWFRFE